MEIRPSKSMSLFSDGSIRATPPFRAALLPVNAKPANSATAARHTAARGTLKAVKNVNEKIAKKITGMDPFDQTAVDDAMIDLDGDRMHKNHLGANAILGVSMAVCVAAANPRAFLCTATSRSSMERRSSLSRARCAM